MSSEEAHGWRFVQQLLPAIDGSVIVSRFFGRMTWALDVGLQCCQCLKVDAEGINIGNPFSGITDGDDCFEQVDIVIDEAISGAPGF